MKRNLTSLAFVAAFAAVAETLRQSELTTAARVLFLVMVLVEVSTMLVVLVVAGVIVVALTEVL